MTKKKPLIIAAEDAMPKPRPRPPAIHYLTARLDPQNGTQLGATSETIYGNTEKQPTNHTITRANDLAPMVTISWKSHTEGIKTWDISIEKFTNMLRVPDDDSPLELE